MSSPWQSLSLPASEPAPIPRQYRFFVAGLPVTQGNHRAFMVGGKPRITEKKPGNLQAWRHAIATEARNALDGDGPLSGPLSVGLDFRLPKPASAPKRRRTWPIGARSGDCDKLARAAFDAMTGVLYADDSQIVSLHVSKDYSDQGYTTAQAMTTPGVFVSIVESS